jgi:hypothetical protein
VAACDGFRDIDGDHFASSFSQLKTSNFWRDHSYVLGRGFVLSNHV